MKVFIVGWPESEGAVKFQIVLAKSEERARALALAGEEDDNEGDNPRELRGAIGYEQREIAYVWRILLDAEGVAATAHYCC